MRLVTQRQALCLDGAQASVEISEVPGGQRLSDEDFIQASHRKEARLGETLM